MICEIQIYDWFQVWLNFVIMKTCQKNLIKNYNLI